MNFKSLRGTKQSLFIEGLKNLKIERLNTNLSFQRRRNLIKKHTMAVDKINVIDFISISPDDKVVLTISDHLEWDEKNEHLLILQNKINSYLDVIENGEIYNLYPDSIGKKFSILVYLKYSPNKIALDFFENVADFLKIQNHTFSYKLKN